jgi:deoxyribodipyrimidine photo-lyase
MPGSGIKRVVAVWLKNLITAQACMTAIAWLRETLRLRANPVLDVDVDVIPVVIDDPRRHGQEDSKTPAWGRWKRRFWGQAVEELEEEIAAAGGDLIHRQGSPEEVLGSILAATDADRIVMPASVTWYEQELEQRLRDEHEVTTVWTNQLYAPAELPFSPEATPDTFTTFRNRLEDAGIDPTPPRSTDPSFREHGLDSDPVQVPAVEDDDRTSVPLKGGPRQARKRLERYIEIGGIDAYADRRNEMHGRDYSSKLSPYLAIGNLDPGQVHHRLERYLEETEDPDEYAVGKLQFELLWREFFRFSFLKHGTAYFISTGIQDRYMWEDDPVRLERWKEGRTGVPIIDACMRELNATGYMSNRGRQLVASFLAHNLNLDWRKGARYMEARLIDSDVHSNWGNWAYVAGVGTDSRDRYFNILKQARKYDPEAAFVKTWIPALEGLPADHAHAPWELSEQMAAMYDLELGEDYPEPVIDLEASYSDIRKRWGQE